MIQKIISGGQTGADQAALDAAIELRIPHGGWVPKGRKTENGILPEKYQLKEMPTERYRERTEQNIIDSHGTIIFSHGDLTGGSKYTKEMAKNHNRPYLHIDLDKTAGFHAAIKINRWIYGYLIEILNVAGPRSSKDPNIYKDVRSIMEAVIRLNILGISKVADFEEPISSPPNTIDEAIERLISEMTLKDKSLMAKMEEYELEDLHYNLGTYIRNNFGLWSGNEKLMESLRKMTDKNDITEDDASAIIINELWKKLKKSHGLRIVKHK